MKRTQNEADIRQVLSVIEDYNTALTLLDDYDHQCMKRPQGSKAIYVLNYEECRKLIDQMRFNADSDLFGHEKGFISYFHVHRPLTTVHAVRHTAVPIFGCHLRYEPIKVEYPAFRRLSLFIATFSIGLSAIRQ